VINATIPSLGQGISALMARREGQRLFGIHLSEVILHSPIIKLLGKLQRFLINLSDKVLSQIASPRAFDRHHPAALTVTRFRH